MRIKVDAEIENASKFETNYNYFVHDFIKNVFFKELFKEAKPACECNFCYALRFIKFKHLENFILLEDPRLFFAMSFEEKIFSRNIEFNDLTEKTFELKTSSFTYRLRIKKIKIVQTPKFSGQMKFVLLSPLTLSVKKFIANNEIKYYLRPNNLQEINFELTKDLIKKAKILGTDSKINQGKVFIEWDENYIKSKFRITKKITLEYPDKKWDVIGILAPFKISGDIELIKAGYKLGFGELNQYGFGMAEIAS
jgi:CRISPR-associated endoribonuclease Cas6